MPTITIRYVTPEPQPGLRFQIAALAARLGAERRGKDPSVTTVLVEEADPESWFIAGRHATEADLSNFWLDIEITGGTNTKAETACFVRSAFSGMQVLLGPLHKECYVYAHAACGDAYGYGGRTQSGRWAAANPG